MMVLPLIFWDLVVEQGDRTNFSRGSRSLCRVRECLLMPVGYPDFSGEAGYLVVEVLRNLLNVALFTV
jgi:hypothetical protein